MDTLKILGTSTIGGVNWKPAVATLADLPTEGNTAGDARIVLDIDEGRIWDADTSTWVPFVASAHAQNTDTMLDEGQPNQVTAAELRGHVDSTLNPHSTTAGQVGADPVGTAAGAVSAHNLAFVHSDIALNTSHRGSTSNPHGVTAAQAGADPAGTASGAISAHNLAFTHADIASNTSHRTTENAINGVVKVDGAGAYSAGVAGDIPVSKIALTSPTYPTLQDLINVLHSAGNITGGTITDAGGATINVAAGKAMLRATDSKLVPLLTCDYAGLAGSAIPSNTIRYIGVQYSAGVPIAVVKTTDTWDENTEFALGNVVNESGTLRIMNNPKKAGNSPSEISHRLYETNPLARADRLGGIIVSGVGTRNIAVTGGEIYDRSNEFIISPINTSSGGTFDAYYRAAVSGFTKEAAQTQWENTKYDDGTGTLATMTANRWAVRWLYITVNGNLLLVYGRAEYTSQALAAAGPVPATVPDRITAQGKLIGRIVFQKSAATGTFSSAFDTAFAGAVVSAHNNLASLDGGTTNEYYHATKDYYDQWSQLPGKCEVPKAFTAAAINTAMANFGTSGGEIFLPAGIWDITTPIVIPAQRIRIRGAGRGTRLLATARLEFDAVTGTLVEGGTITGSIGAGTATIIAIRYDTATTGVLWYNNRAGTDFVNNEICSTGGANVTVNGAPTNPAGCFTVAANNRVSLAEFSAIGGYGEGVTADKFLTTTGGSGLSVRNCFISGFNSNDFSIVDATYFSVSDNIIEKYTSNVSIAISHGASTDAMGLISGNSIVYNSTGQDSITTSANSHRIIIGGNRGNRSRGSYVLGGDYAIVSNNILWDPNAGITISTGADYCIVSGNNVTTAQNSGITISGNYATVTGNNVSSANQRGIYLNGTSGTTVSGNTVQSSGGSHDDIQVNSSNYCTVIGNACIGGGTTNNGINLTTATYCVIASNYTRGHDVAGISEDAASNNNEIRANNTSSDATPYVLAGTAGLYFRSMRLSPEYPGSVLYYDGGSNDPGSEGWNATMETDGNYRRNYYEWSSTVITGLQDAELRIRIEIPQDFISFQDSAILVDIKTEENAATNNAIDASVQKDGSATAAVSKTGIKSTVAATWYTCQAGTSLITFTASDLSGLAFTAGSVVNLTLKLYSQDSKYARVGDVCLKYKAR